MKRISEKLLADDSKCLSKQSPAVTAWCQEQEFQSEDFEFLKLAADAAEASVTALKDDDKEFPKSAFKVCDSAPNPTKCLREKYEIRKKMLIALKA